MAEDRLRGRVDTLFGLLDMNEFRDRRCGKLSTGMKQKVSIARALIHDPSVMIFDEPTLGLDVLTARIIVSFIRDCRTQGKTVIFSTHVMSEVEKLCDVIAIIHGGRILAEGTLAQLRGAHRPVGSGGSVCKNCGGPTMNLRDLGIVYRKELRDLLRDKRTIISMIVVPLLLMPLMSAGVGTIAIHQVHEVMQETYPVMVLGGEDSPDTVGALRKVDNLEFVPPSPEYKQQIADKKIRAAVEIPPGFDAAVKAGTPATIQIYDYDGEFKSETATRTLRDFFADWRETTVAQRLAEHKLPKDFVHPFEVDTTNVAPPEKVSGNLLGALLPYIIMITCLTGAIYPAVDLTAGEKERGKRYGDASCPARCGGLTWPWGNV